MSIQLRQEAEESSSESWQDLSGDELELENEMEVQVLPEILEKGAREA